MLHCCAGSSPRRCLGPRQLLERQDVMLDISGTPKALHFAELEETPHQRVTEFFNLVMDTARSAMFGNQISLIVSVGYNSSGMDISISVPPDLRGIVPAQRVHYNAKVQGRDSTVIVTFVHED